MLRKSNEGFAPSRAGSSLHPCEIHWDKDYDWSMYCACEAGLLQMLGNTVIPCANRQILKLLLLELQISLPHTVWAFLLPRKRQGLFSFPALNRLTSRRKGSQPRAVCETGRNAPCFALGDEYPQRLPHNRISPSAFEAREESHRFPRHGRQGKQDTTAAPQRDEWLCEREGESVTKVGGHL